LKNKLKVFIDPILQEFEAPAMAAIREVIETAGWQIEQGSVESECEITYSDSQVNNNIFSFAGYDAWSALHTSTPIQTNKDEIVPSRAVIVKDGVTKIDWVMVAHFFLCGIYERDPECIEKNGIPGIGALKWGIGNIPILNHIALKAAKALCNSKNIPAPKPMWPFGKSWAVSISHDCDRLFKYRTQSFFADSILEFKRGKYLSSLVSFSKGLFSTGASLVKDDPYYSSWVKWIQVEANLGIRSAYYIGTWNRFDKQSTYDDIRYSPKNDKLKQIVNKLISGGWEIGLHSATLAWKYENRFEIEKNRFKEYFGVIPTGIRGHLWSLNPNCPIDSIARIKSAGFCYDSSLGMNLIHGFRRGAAYPFKPYDDQNGTSFGLWELPPIMMDYSLFKSGNSNKERIKSFQFRLESVKKYNGLMLLDWHEYVLSDKIMDGLGLKICDELKSIKDDKQCWFATPMEIYDWCAKKRWD